MFKTTTVTRAIDVWEAELKDALIGAFDEHRGDEKQIPDTIRLSEYPTKLIDRIFANEIAHPYVLESHLDKRGAPFSSVMGFAYMDGKITIMSRRNGAKIRRLQEDPRWCITYHNNRQRPDELGCITLVGSAHIDTDKDRVQEANVILSHKVYRDNDPDVGFRDPMIESMKDADRVLITLEDIEALYMVTPMVPGLPPGIPTPPIAWRADWVK
jgi:hypothetical protein